MRSSANVSAFAARRTVGPKEPSLGPEDLTPREDTHEDAGLSAAVEDDDLSESSTSEDENQFAVLGDNKTDPSTSPRRIFELGEDAVRIELLETQSITVLGIYTIWVRSGDVTVLGARLQASPMLHKIYAPATFALPRITACSRQADFILAGTDDALCDMHIDTKRVVWDVPGLWRSSTRSFYILGYSFPDEEVLRKHLKILDLVRWRSTMASISKRLPEGRTVFVCGSGSTGKSTFCRAYSNQILAGEAFSQHISESQAGVVLLDLDLGQPELMPPGLIYVAHIQSTLLGPPDTHHAIPGSRQSRLLRMHYLGGIEGDPVSRLSIAAIQDLLQYCETVRKDRPGCTVLVNSSSWLLDMDDTQLSSLISMMHPSDIVYFDSSGTLKRREVLTQSMGDRCNLWGLASKVYRSAPATTIHWNHMQSYFHLVAPERNGPSWHPLALLSVNKKEISYSGPDSRVWAVVTLGERLAPDNLAQALEDSTVALVIVDEEDSGNAELSHARDGPPKQSSGHSTPNVPDMHDEQQADPADIVRTGAENLPYFRDSEREAAVVHPRRSRCLGLAYITAIDPAREIIEAVTPIPDQIIFANKDHRRGLVIVIGRQDRRWAPVRG